MKQDIMLSLSPSVAHLNQFCSIYTYVLEKQRSEAWRVHNKNKLLTCLGLCALLVTPGNRPLALIRWSRSHT